MGAIEYLNKQVFVLAGLTTEGELKPCLVDSQGRQVLVNTQTEATLTATASLNFAEIAAAASATLTITVPGAAVGDAVAIARPASPTAGLIIEGFVSATDTVSIRATNITASPIDAAAATYRATVFKPV